MTRGDAGVDDGRLFTVIVKYVDVLFRRTQKEPLVALVTSGKYKLANALFVML